MSDHVHAVVVVHGTVQGVGFRWWTRRRLDLLGLDGTATNLPDGTVEIEVRGPRHAVVDLVRHLRSGDTPGRVTDVQVVGPSDAGADSGSLPR